MRLKRELAKCEYRPPALRMCAFTTCVKHSGAMVSLVMTVRCTSLVLVLTRIDYELDLLQSPLAECRPRSQRPPLAGDAMARTQGVVKYASVCRMHTSYWVDEDTSLVGCSRLGGLRRRGCDGGDSYSDIDHGCYPCGRGAAAKRTQDIVFA